MRIRGKSEVPKIYLGSIAPLVPHKSTRYSYNGRAHLVWSPGNAVIACNYSHLVSPRDIYTYEGVYSYIKRQKDSIVDWDFEQEVKRIQKGGPMRELLPDTGYIQLPDEKPPTEMMLIAKYIDPKFPKIVEKLYWEPGEQVYTEHGSVVTVKYSLGLDTAQEVYGLLIECIALGFKITMTKRFKAALTEERGE